MEMIEIMEIIREFGKNADEAYDYAMRLYDCITDEPNNVQFAKSDLIHNLGKLQNMLSAILDEVENVGVQNGKL